VRLFLKESHAAAAGRADCRAGRAPIGLSISITRSASTVDRTQHLNRSAWNIAPPTRDKPDGFVTSILVLATLAVRSCSCRCGSGPPATGLQLRTRRDGQTVYA
jgi:hypothetical protein